MQTRSLFARLTILGAIAGAVLAGGCASKPGITQTGFLSDYSKLESVNDSRMRYESPRASEYARVIIDPVQVAVGEGKLDASERAELARHFHDELVRAVQGAGYQTTTRAGVGVARVRVALTRVAASSWWQKVHPVSRAVGAGTGGAAMEGEVIDSVTGEQIGAVIQAGTGNQFDVLAFSTMDDIKNAVSQWADILSARLKELHDARR